MQINGQKVIGWQLDDTLDDLNLSIAGLREGERLIINGCPENIYRASEGFSTSELKTAILKGGKEPVISTAHWKAAKEKGFESKPHFDFGTLVHWAALEPERIEKELVIKPSIALNTNEGKQNYIAWMLQKLTEYGHANVITNYEEWIKENTETVTTPETIEVEEEQTCLPAASDALKYIFELVPEYKKEKIPKRSKAEKEAAVDHLFSMMPEEKSETFQKWIKENTITEKVKVKKKTETTKKIGPKITEKYKKLESIFPLVCVSTNDYHSAKRIHKKITDFKAMHGIEFLATEVSCWVRYKGHILKGRLDAIGNDLNIYDIKTTAEIEEGAFLRAAERLKYQFQGFTYTTIFGLQCFRWLGVEKQEPFSIAPFQVFSNMDWLTECAPIVIKAMDAIAWAKENKIYNDPYNEFKAIEPYRYKQDKKVEEENVNTQSWVPIHDPSENFTWGSTNGA